MSFDPNAYGGEVAAILALDGAGERLMPLAAAECSCAEARALLKAAAPNLLFPQARAPEAAMAGLYLYFSCWNEAHETAQDIHTPEGSYWHAMVHRQEPDDGNSAYWFRQVGIHPIFPALAQAAVERTWDPQAFIALCARARSLPGSELERKALHLQRTEWQLLFDFCAAQVTP
ncbi:conserved hypothetical protein [Candidatus Sulfopaludibacter sp. SbA3]|nr:conserved hypothetical protein [Candidatus Sulfopaludibacter sp. SbA3]